MAPKIHSSEDARRLARKRLPWMVFDYIDGAAGTETGAARNRAAFDALELRPRILRNVSDRSLSVPLWGKPTKAPFGISPMGMCNLSGPGADMMLARLAAREARGAGVRRQRRRGEMPNFETLVRIQHVRRVVLHAGLSLLYLFQDRQAESGDFHSGLL